eukprot:TRINITY_DN1594_c0_g1_i11.p3 TRINITY_DN1594_c0_g1~~TRINITY_DN1594_c0_g1_i11.p3  ORF type:complete len:169 (+),score=28.77 TRINITY_DN1594_c0_g1_i11:1089-1595(+)
MAPSYSYATLQPNKGVHYKRVSLSERKDDRIEMSEVEVGSVVVSNVLCLAATDSLCMLELRVLEGPLAVIGTPQNIRDVFDLRACQQYHQLRWRDIITLNTDICEWGDELCLPVDVWHMVTRASRGALSPEKGDCPYCKGLRLGVPRMKPRSRPAVQVDTAARVLRAV